MRSNLKDKLFILTTSTIPNYLKTNKYDILAFSMGSIVSLNNLNLDYSTADIYVKRTNFYKISLKFKSDFENWLSENDTLLKIKNIEKSFYPNAFWMMHRLANYLYLVLLTEKLKKKYKSFHIITSQQPNEWFPLEKNIKNWSFSYSGNSLNHAVDLIYFLLESPNYEIYGKENGFKFHLSMFLSILKRSKSIIFKRFKFLIQMMKYSKTSKVAVLQDGYDVSFISQNFSTKKILNIKNMILQKIPEKIFTNKKLEKEIKKQSEKFFYKWFGKLSEKIIESYCNQISIFCNLNALILRESEITLKKNKIKHLLCSIGVQDQIEYLISRSCNKLNIKIHSFKHSGIENIFFKNSILDDYLEKKSNPPRIQYLHSKMEEERFKNLKEVETNILGRLEIVDFKYLEKKSNPNILYCLGPENHTSFKEMDRITYDSERYKFIIELLKCSSNHNLKLDFKLHPKERRDQFNNLKNIIKNYKKIKFSILPEGTVENIFCQYNLIIIDMAYTRVFSSLLYLKKDFILFLPNDIDVEPNHFAALNERVHIIRKVEELEFKIIEFKEKKLKKKKIKPFNNFYLKYPSTEEIDIIKKELGL